MRWVTSVSPAPADGHRWTRRGHDTGIARLQPCDDDDDDDDGGGDGGAGGDDDSGDVDQDIGKEILIVNRTPDS